MIVKDNFLNKKDFKKIQDLITGSDFPWFVSNGINYKNDGHTQFFHNFYNQGMSSIFFDCLLPLLHKLEVVSLIRIKANSICATSKIIEHEKHIDVSNVSNAKTAVFYVNTNNGYTHFKDNKKIKSIKNRICIFDTNMLHGGTTCTDSKRRIVINFNYFFYKNLNKKIKEIKNES
jgi:hypothetical protein